MTMRKAQLEVSLAMLLACAGACAQQQNGSEPQPAKSQTQTKIGPSVQTVAPKLPTVQGGQQLDRVVAIVNGDLIPGFVAVWREWQRVHAREGD